MADPEPTPPRAEPSGELWSVRQAAQHWGVSDSRARAILASRRIARVSGYPAEEIKRVLLRQGTRTDLAAPAARAPKVTDNE